MFHVSVFVGLAVISLLYKRVKSPVLVVISKPEIWTPLASVTVLCSNPLILVISLLFPSLIVNNKSGELVPIAYLKLLSDIFKYKL